MKFCSLILIILLLGSCTRSPISLPLEEMEKAGGESNESMDVFKESFSIDTAVSTLSGSKLLDHLNSLSEYLEKASESVNVTRKKAIEKLPAVSVQVHSLNEMKVYQRYMERRKKFNIDQYSMHSTVLPFQKLSVMAIQLQIVRFRLKHKSHHKSNTTPST